MALKKQVSSLFRKRSSKVYELPADDVVRAGPSQFGPLENIQEDEDDELRVAIQASLDHELENSRKQIEQLKAAISASAREIQPREHRTNPSQASVTQDPTTSDEIARLKGIIASLQDDNQTQSDYFEHTQRDFAQQVQEVETRMGRKLCAAETQIKELKFNNDMFKTSNEMGREELKSKNRTIESLQERLTYAERGANVDSAGSDLLRLQAALRKENQGLRNQVNGFDEEKQKMLAWFQKKRTEMSDAQAAFEAQMAQVITEKEDAKQALNAVATASQDLERFQSHFSNTTPRALLMMKSSSKRGGPHTPTDSCRRFRETGAIQHLSRASLDLPLSPSEASNFLESLNHNQNVNIATSITLKMCSLCQNPKFMQQSSGNNPLGERLNEFPKGFEKTTCCSAPICASCLPTAIFKAIEIDWWHNLDSQAWIRCPVEKCELVMSIKNVGELERMLYRLGDDDAATHIARYEKATVLRAALQKLSSQPSSEVLRISSNLHSQLITRNRMYSFFDPRFNNTIPDEYGRLPEFNPGNLLLANIDQGDQTIPIFTRFFRRTATPQECSICAESRYELDIESADAWRASCEGFHGPWMWNVLLFPTKYSLECEHDMDACKECVVTHLSTQLEEFGVNGCDRLSCLTCSRVLSHREVKLHAKPETFQKYDRFHLLKMLSAEPNFRWCLREGCPSGQLYEQTEYLDPHIVCEECDFEMCFTHQHPWHTDLTCAQFDSQREHGDPDFHDTQEWLREHTKPCPGCKVDVEKHEGCFHMTCRACTHEFCWTCLADWGEINPRSGEYRRGAHNEGCFFRTSNVQPTAIQGNDLQAALAGST